MHYWMYIHIVLLQYLSDMYFLVKLLSKCNDAECTPFVLVMYNIYARDRAKSLQLSKLVKRVDEKTGN